MNKLQRYLKKTGQTPSALAAKMGRSPSTLTRLMHGQRDPSMSLAEDIEIATKGAVMASDLMRDAMEKRREMLKLARARKEKENA